MSSRTACWWQARLPGLVVGVAIGVALWLVTLLCVCLGGSVGKLQWPFLARSPHFTATEAGAQLLYLSAVFGVIGFVTLPGTRVTAIHQALVGLCGLCRAMIRGRVK